MGKSNAKTKFEVPREDNKAYELTKLMSLDTVDCRRRYFVAELNHFGQNAAELITMYLDRTNESITPYSHIPTLRLGYYINPNPLFNSS